MQHSKCCVVSQPPWVQIPALPPLPPGPDGAGRLCHARVVCVVLLIPPVFRVSEGPAVGPSCCVCPWAALSCPSGVRARACGCCAMAQGQISAQEAGVARVWMLLDVPLVIRVPEGPAVGPSCCVCPWVAARPRAVRAASFARRVVSKPARALRTLRRPPHRWGLVWCWLAWCVGSLFGQAPPPPAGTAAWPRVA